MSGVFALTQDARRRVEKNDSFYDRTAKKLEININASDAELILLLAIAMVLVKSGDNPILLLAIMYVII